MTVTSGRRHAARIAHLAPFGDTAAGASPSHKVTSLLAESGDGATTREKYEEIYRDSDAWLYSKSHGVHSVVYTLIEEQLPDRAVLDIGCGAGRMAIMCAHSAARVTGIDFSPTAVSLAELNATCAGQDVTFLESDIERFCAESADKYDVITMLGVLEHVADPTQTLRDISAVVHDGGTVVVSCPNFINPRGFTYMTLLTLFHLPMSLADLRQVDYFDMREWAAASGYSVEQAVGALFDFSWGEKAYADMKKRVPLALRDSALDLDLDHAQYEAWLKRGTKPMADTLEWLENHGALRRIERRLKMRLERVVDVDDALWDRMADYMNENIGADPFYSTEPPFCYLGGECIYVLEKLA
jgi:ubiquinone biosynthesis O-methyltransferase